MLAAFSSEFLWKENAFLATQKAATAATAEANAATVCNAIEQSLIVFLGCLNSRNTIDLVGETLILQAQISAEELRQYGPRIRHSSSVCGTAINPTSVTTYKRALQFRPALTIDRRITRLRCYASSQQFGYTPHARVHGGFPPLSEDAISIRLNGGFEN
jgi:hypothetical protein